MEKVLNVVNKKEIQTDYVYWQQKTAQDRIDAIEILRLQYLQMQKNVQQGLQRVYRIVKRK
jgi:hypothetical protein